MDETDLGVFPSLKQENGLDIVNHAVPSWAVKANKQPTLIHFEELNRCSSNIRNAVLGILLERIIGTEFTFNDHVFMVASGNPVTDYDNDVESFGFALRNRLIPVEFELTLNQWRNEFADKNIIQEIIGFLTTKPDYFGNTITQLNKFIGSDQSQYPSPRSWTFLSDYLKAFTDPKERLNAIQDRKTIDCFVGEIASSAFVNYCLEFYKISVKDILKGKVKPESLDNMTVQRITQEFQDEYKFNKLNTEEQKNWEKFISFMNDEIKAGHLSFLATEADAPDANKTVFKKLFKEHANVAKIIVKKIK